jgi:hypothetical protein
MNAVAVQLPGFERDEIVIARDQPEYASLPALGIMIGDAKGVLTRWRPTDQERIDIANGADVWLETVTFGYPFQPVRLGTECPITSERES